MNEINQGMDFYKEKKLKEYSLADDYCRKPEPADLRVIARNPMCGDRFEIGFREKEGRFETIYYQGDGCMLSRASAHLLCHSLFGRDSKEFKSIKKQLDQLLSDSTFALTLTDFEVFKPLTDFPLRKRCVQLVWDSMEKFLEKRATQC